MERKEELMQQYERLSGELAVYYVTFKSLSDARDLILEELLKEKLTKAELKLLLSRRKIIRTTIYNGRFPFSLC